MKYRYPIRIHEYIAYSITIEKAMDIKIDRNSVTNTNIYDWTYTNIV